MKKPLCILLAVVLVFTATVAAACAEDKDPSSGADVFGADDEMRLVIAYDEPKEKAVPEYRSLLTLRHDAGGEQRLTVTPEDAR